MEEWSRDIEERQRTLTNHEENGEQGRLLLYVFMHIPTMFCLCPMVSYAFYLTHSASPYSCDILGSRP